MVKYLDGTGLSHLWDKIKSLTSGKVDKETGKGLSSNDYTSEEKTKLSGIATGAEVNQNTFSNVKVGSTTIAADSKTDTLEIAAGSNVTLTPDTTNDKVTIAATDTTYSVATTSANGLMSSSDKTKLNRVGTREAVTLSSNKTLSSASSIATLTNIINVSLDEGSWIVIGQISFPGGSGTSHTTRRVSISNSSSGSNYGMTSIATINNVGVVLQVCATVELDSTTTIYLNAAQNSGSSMTITSGIIQRLTAVRVA